MTDDSSKETSSTMPAPQELRDDELEKASGGLMGGDDDLNDLEVERLRARRR